MSSTEDNQSDQSSSSRNEPNGSANQSEPSNQDKNSGNMSWRQAMTTVGLALAIPWMIGVPTLIGWWIDKKYETAPVWFIVGLVAGLVTTAVDIVRLMRRFGQFK
ncbi:MAG TPA: AtpZ/AtpI family protein [Blastocatellia bacterium]|nr:AtpZ/AtpI family protein [Blastocatellia bacterium]